MSDDHSQYLTDEVTVETIYSHLKNGDVPSATAFLISFGDDKTVMKTWIGVQCDINNVKKDPYASEKIAREGVKFALARDYKTGAAMMLHNISSFHLPNWDEGVDPNVIPGIIEVATLQVNLREQLEDKNSLGWAYWDQGIALLAGLKTSEAINGFKKSVEVAESIGDRDLAAWANLFIGKSMIKENPSIRHEGENVMRQAVATINEVGEDWEKEEVVKILASVGL